MSATTCFIPLDKENDGHLWRLRSIVVGYNEENAGEECDVGLVSLPDGYNLINGTEQNYDEIKERLTKEGLFVHQPSI